MSSLASKDGDILAHVCVCLSVAKVKPSHETVAQFNHLEYKTKSSLLNILCIICCYFLMEQFWKTLHSCLSLLINCKLFLIVCVKVFLVLRVLPVVPLM